MSRSLPNSILSDFDQQKASADKNGRLEDYLRHEIVITRSGVKLYIAVVADGGGKVAPDRAAKLAVDTIFDESKKSKENDPAEILRISLFSANQAVHQLANGGDYVGLTIVLVKDDRIYVGQAGRLTRAYLVRNNSKYEQIQGDTQSESCLGDNPDNPEINIKTNITVKPGERIILCSDGLFNPPADPNNANTSEEIAKKVELVIPVVGQYDDIRGSARHLSSIAKGMDVSDDITVLILGFGRKQHAGVTKAIPAIIGGVLVLVIIFSVYIFTTKNQVTSQDIGLAFLVKGNVSPAPQKGQYITAGTTISVASDGPVDLRLQPQTGAQNIPGLDLYIAPSSVATLTTINLASSNSDSKLTNKEDLDKTTIKLSQGQLLIVSNTSRSFVILTQIQNGIEIHLNPGSREVLGVKIINSNLEVDCIQGNCEFILPKGTSQTLKPSGKSVFDLASSNILSQDQPLQDSDKKDWTTLCQNAQLQNINQLDICNITK